MASDLVERLRHCSQNTRDEYLHELTGRAADRISQQDSVIAGLVDLLAKATADIAAALIITDKQDVVAAWCEKYVDAINKHDAEAAALAKAKESRDD